MRGEIWEGEFGIFEVLRVNLGRARGSPKSRNSGKFWGRFPQLFLLPDLKTSLFFRQIWAVLDADFWGLEVFLGGGGDFHFRGVLGRFWGSPMGGSPLFFLLPRPPPNHTRLLPPPLGQSSGSAGTWQPRKVRGGLGGVWRGPPNFWGFPKIWGGPSKGRGPPPSGVTSILAPPPPG